MFASISTPPRDGARTGSKLTFTAAKACRSLPRFIIMWPGGAPSPNRGVRRRGYFVLRRTSIPAVLVECGFLTNAYEASYVSSATYRQKLADEIARGVRSRGSVANSRVTNAPASESLATAAEAVPLQPFLDQTRVHDPDLSRSKHHKGSKSKKTSSSKKKKSSTSSSESSSKKKKSSSSGEQQFEKKENVDFGGVIGFADPELGADAGSRRSGLRPRDLSGEVDGAGRRWNCALR